MTEFSSINTGHLLWNKKESKKSIIVIIIHPIMAQLLCRSTNGRRCKIHISVSALEINPAEGLE